MMKKYILFLLSLALLPTGCSDFLELEPHSQSIAPETAGTDAAVFQTAVQAEAALAGAYSDFKNEYYQLDYFVNGDAQADDAYAGGDNPANFQIDEFKLDALNSNVSRDWRYLYGTIGKTNRVINNIRKVTDAALTPQRSDEILGEALFIRAFMYFQLVQLWGDVPLLLTEVSTISAANLEEIYPILFPAREPTEKVYAQIVSDLETALPLVRVTADHKGFATKGAVNTLLAYVYATRTPHDWAKVRQYCEAVKSGGYTLLPDYNQLWDNAHENSPEAIFEINYSGGATDGNWGTKIFRGFDWKKFNLPANDLVAAFDAEGDMVRKNASIVFLDVTGKWSDPHWPQTRYPFINKYRRFNEGSDQNYIFYRLADVMLLLAEALNEQNDVAGAAALVNAIRSRAGLKATTADTQEKMRLAIEKERRLELAFEAHRWFDLRRTGRAIAVMNATTGVNGASLGYQLNTDRLLWPIPQAELDKNSKLIQNSGY